MMRPASALILHLLLPRSIASLRPVVAGLILIATAGCDNMSWGGVQWSLESSARNAAVEGDVDADGEPLEEETAAGPVLFLVERDPDGALGAASLIPLATLAGDSLRPILDDGGFPGFPTDFAAEQLAAGRTFTLFAEGTRVGTFHSSGDVSTDASFCFPRPRARGVVEVVTEAAGATHFLALRRDGGQAFRHGPVRRMDHNYDQRVTSLNLAGELFPRLAAPRPPSVLDARRDLRIFALDGSGTGAMAATFMHDDVLDVGPPRENSWALFFIAESTGSGYSPGYVWFRNTANGKAAPRFVSHFDWNRDGTAGVLLEVQGAERRWYAAAGKRGGVWQTIFEDPCGQMASTGRAGALD